MLELVAPMLEKTKFEEKPTGEALRIVDTAVPGGNIQTEMERHLYYRHIVHLNSGSLFRTGDGLVVRTPQIINHAIA